MERQQIIIPKYINCKTNEDVCDWYMHHQCKERCPYALDIKGLGCGAMDEGLVRLLNDMRDNKLKLIKGDKQ